MFRFFVFVLVLPLCCYAESPTRDEECPNGNKHYRATVRHIERGGIGYKDGYTTLETFFSPDPSLWSVTPFLDARGHIFDNGKWAANAGVGARTLWKTRAYGVNVYYDYRNVGHIQANQIGVGLETLGEVVDFRINGYFPVGKKISRPYNTLFDTFSGHYMLLAQTYQSVMTGVNAEFGFHFGNPQFYDLYAAAGPYFFTGKMAPATWGGKARIACTFKEFLTLEISDSYDKTFHNKLQGELALKISFGQQSKIKKRGHTCKSANRLNDRMLQPVNRQEIIVADIRNKDTIGIDPATGQPYYFVFVDNTSNSDGTYESPYHSLLQAQENSSPNDIIYVFPGDGTSTGMDAGIMLQANQKFWGSGLDYSVTTSQGTVLIPAQSTSAPVIKNSDITGLGNVITLATNNTISGFYITSALNDAIYGDDPQSFTVSSCTITNINTYTIETTHSTDTTISLTDNQFLANTNGISLTLQGTSSIVCSNNTFANQTSVSSLPIDISSTNNVLNATLENNVFNENRTGSIRFDLTDVVNANINLVNNTITNNRTGSISDLGSSVVILPNGTIDNCSIALIGNTFSGNEAHCFYVPSGGQFTTIEVTASENTMFDSTKSGVSFQSDCSTFTFNATNNTLSDLQNDAFAFGGGDYFSTATITISENTINNIGDITYYYGSGINISQSITTLNLTVEDNTISNCLGSGVLCYATELSNMTTNISGNVMNNCQNQDNDNAASAISLDTYVTLTATIENNTLSSNGTPSIAIGYYTVDNPNVCLTLADNGGDTDQSYILVNPGSGAFNLSPCNVDTINVGTIIPSGAITSVCSCSNPTPCSP